jgi:long-chain acyl-CoA synthetase
MYRNSVYVCVGGDMDQTNILLFLENRTEILDNKIALGMKSSLGWKELTFQGLGILSRRLANYLIKNGVEKGDKLAILSESMPEWGAALFASVLAGSISIPLDIKLTEFELTSILNDCMPKVLLVSSAYLEMAIKLQKEINSIEQIIILNDNGIKDYPNIYNIPDESERKWRHRAMSKTAFIIYTSGTTGTPKGVEISFKNAWAQVQSVSQCFDLGIKDKFLSILPMNHLFELTVGFLSFLSKGTSIYYSQSLKPKDLFNIIQEKQITFMIVVPAFLKLLRSSIEQEINQMSPIKKAIFGLNYKIAELIPFYPLRKLMFLPIHKKFGGKFKGCISGGAPLDVTVGKFFETIGMRVYEGYGLSEASPVVAVNRENKCKLGSIGRPIPNVEVKLDPKTSELLVKGDNVMKGYYKRPELTAEVIMQDGWLRTGDIASIDKDGFIYITGRIKSMIVLNGGKKVFPEDLEAVFEKSPKFAEICVFGAKRSGGSKDGTEDIYMAIVPTQEMIDKYPDEAELEAELKKEVKVLSQKISSYKRPNNIIITKSALPRTGTRKVKRNDVKKELVGIQ